MPVQQSGWRDQERRPPDAWQETACSRQEESIRRPERRPPHLPTQQRQLVAKHDNLELLELSGAEQKKDELKHTPERDVAY